MSTARCRGGSSCSAVTNASETASLASYWASGPGALSASPSSAESGSGSSQGTSPSRVGSGVLAHGTAAVGGRRLPARSAFRQRLVATRYSQVRTDDRASNPANPRQAASSVSCSASSASCIEPSIR